MRNKTSNLLKCLCVLSMQLLYSGSVAGQTQPGGNMQMSPEFNEAVEKLHMFYTNIIMDATEKKFLPPPGGKDVFSSSDTDDVVLAEQRNLTYFANADKYFRMDFTAYKADNLKKPHVSVIGIVTPVDSFLIQCLDNGKYALSGNKKTTASELERVNAHFFTMLRTDALDTNPYSL